MNLVRVSSICGYAHISTRWYDDVARLDEIQFSSYDIEMMNDAESLD